MLEVTIKIYNNIASVNSQYRCRYCQKKSACGDFQNVVIYKNSGNVRETSIFFSLKKIRYRKIRYLQKTSVLIKSQSYHQWIRCLWKRKLKEFIWRCE